MNTVSERPLHSVVVPVFNEVEGIDRFHERCSADLVTLADEYEIVYVDDGAATAHGSASWRPQLRTRM